MAEHRPVVLINGTLHELPTGDSVTGVTPPEEQMYASRVDFISDDELYRGEAAPGSAESSAVWRIRKIVIGSDGDVTQTFADGDENFDNIWNDRLSLTYS